MKHSFFLSVSAILCAFCFSLFSATAKDDPAAKPWRVIAGNAQSVIEKPNQIVIRNEEDWKVWWNEYSGSEEADMPHVDFAKETVLIACMGYKTTGGYSIEFTDIQTKDDAVTATVVSHKPAVDAIVTQALTSPYTVIAIPKTAGKVAFVLK